ncbi:MAG: hypothetical protein ABI588_09085 [Arenimonas sp.]
MSRYPITLLLLAACLGLTACETPNDDSDAAKKPAVVAVLVAPKTANDAEWKTYLGQVINQHMEGVTDRQTAYYLPANSTVVPPDASDGRSLFDRQAENVTTVISRTVLPGNMLSFGSPDSAKMADLMLSAFSGAKPDALRGSQVLFVGKAEDSSRVQAAVEASGAKYIFVEAK